MGTVCYHATTQPILINTGADRGPGQHAGTPGRWPQEDQVLGTCAPPGKPQQKKNNNRDHST